MLARNLSTVCNKKLQKPLKRGSASESLFPNLDPAGPEVPYPDQQHWTLQERKRVAREAGVPDNFFDAAKTKAFLNLNKAPQKSILKKGGGGASMAPPAQVNRIFENPEFRICWIWNQAFWLNPDPNSDLTPGFGQIFYMVTGTV